jgi:RNA polymerase sigma-70 factor (ECF subfamily)
MTGEAAIHSWGDYWGGGAKPAAGPTGAARPVDFDAELVEKCLNGSDRAWEQLVKMHTRLVYSACYRFTGRADDARDLTQDVFIKVFRNLHSFDADAGSFKTWLVRLTRNLLIDNYRKTKKHQALDPLDDQAYALEETSGLGGQADRTLRRREAGELLQAGLERLSPELREAVILRDIQQLEYREIGQALKIPDGTVKSRINRGRRELARQLRSMGAE